MSNTPLIGIVMGSASDAPTMRKAAAILEEFGIPYEIKVCSAHRTPARAHAYGTTAKERGLKCIIAAAGMAAHLAGVMGSLTTLPILGVPMDGKFMGGLDALLATVQMPKGIPVATFTVGSHGAVNAALFAVAMLAVNDPEMSKKLDDYRAKQTAAIPEDLPAE
ncbi:MAG: 5-(carboxyamino)imidazole ribonucleotide mutase [Phycisphaeraceae bacterium]|nr:5-(carboxyamino)imidazole ribonucleotide mutase [Phycisphaeraceae bacterium]